MSVYPGVFVNANSTGVGAGSSGLGSDTIGWGYQDFTAGSIASTNVTLTANENGSGFIFSSANIVSGSAVVVRADNTETKAYTGTLKLFSRKVDRSSHTGDSVTLTGVPHVSWGDIRIYYLYNYGNSLPDFYTIPARRVSGEVLNELDALFITEEELDIELATKVDVAGDTMTGSLTLANISGNPDEIVILTNSGELIASGTTIADISGGGGGGGSSTLVGGTGITVVESPTDTWTINVDDYISATEVADISGDLDLRISILESIDHDSFITEAEVASISGDLQSQITTIETDVATISGDLSSLETRVDNIDVVSGTGITIVESPTDTWTVNVDDYISATEVASVSAGLQSQITDISDDFVLKTGDTMTGDLVMSSSSVVVTGGQIKINDAILAKTQTDNVVTNTIIDTIPVSSGNCAFWDLLVKDGTNYRASRLMVVWNDAATEIKINETSTESIGNTDGVDMNVMFNIGNTEIQLKATISSGMWTIRAFKKVL